MNQLLEYFSKFNVLSAGAKIAIEGITKEIAISKGKDLQPTGHTCKTIYPEKTCKR